MYSFLEKISKEIFEIEQEQCFLNKKLSQLEEERNNFIIKNKVYETNYNKYIDKNIDSISLVIKDKNKIYIEKNFDDIEINKNEKIEVIKYGEMSHWGIKWSDKENSYIVFSSFKEKENNIEILGIFDILLHE